jgi:hypothetical protein
MGFLAEWISTTTPSQDQTQCSPRPLLDVNTIDFMTSYSVVCALQNAYQLTYTLWLIISLNCTSAWLILIYQLQNLTRSAFGTFGEFEW